MEEEGLTKDRFSSKHMPALVKCLQAPKGVYNLALIYLILRVYELGSDYPGLMSGLVARLKQRLTSFTDNRRL